GGGARPVSIRVLGAEPHVFARARGQLAAAEAIAPVRRDRPAERGARRRLLLIELRAALVRPRDVRVEVVRALGAGLGVARRDQLVGIALVIPFAVVVARAAVRVP